MHQLISSLPHHTLRDLAKKHGPLMHLQLGEVPTIVISSPETAKEVLKDHATIFAQRPYLLASKIMSYDSTNIVFSPYGNYWRQLRKISTMELLSPSRVQSFRFIREEEVSALIKTISLIEGSPVNLSEKIFSMTYGITSRAAFGKKSKDQEEFIRIMMETIKLAGGFCLADMYPSNELLKLISGVRLKLEKLQRASDRILEDIVFDRKGNVDEAGIHELKFLRSIVKETLRLHPAAPLLVPRECDENCVISGYDILAKSKVIVNAWAIGRDSRYWKDAENFNPERFLDSPIDFRGTHFEYIPFGAGRRICPGISFALPNIELPLAQLLYHFDWKLPNGSNCEDLDMTECFGITVRRKNDLFLIPIPYHPLPSE
ncbi:Cytochrome P450 - like 10 [Theobroma cacao]|nr:Cytochrome P450 - like 10 [Theobroma cacao]